MKYFYQINNLEKKETKFYNSKRKLISEDKLPKNIIKVAMGFPYAIIFHPPLDGKIYAYVIDQAGRKQYFYTKEYKEQMEEKKFKNFPKLIDKVDRLIEYCQTHKNDITTAIMLMNDCNFRIGHEKYKKLYDTNGTLTLNSRHIKKNENKITIEFLGKKKEKNFCSLKNKNTILYKTLDNFLDKKQKLLFNDLKYDDVYDFLKDFELRPKDIRQVSANREFYDLLREIDFEGDFTSQKETKKYLKQILEETSYNMNHTPTVCKKEYLMPQWFEFTEEKLEKLLNFVNKNDFKDTIEYIIKKNY